MSEQERYIPTPEELEQGLKRGNRRAKDDVEGRQKARGRRMFLIRAKGVGRRRTYVEPDSEPVDLTKSKPQAKTSQSLEQTTDDLNAGGGQRVRSVRVPKRETPTKAARPTIDLHSPEGQFFARAKAKGHTMGTLISDPHTTNRSASCVVCGLDGELVIQYDENYANQTYEFFRGPAMERRCQTI